MGQATSGPRRDDGPRPGELAGPERLQKILAHAGIGSRRACEELILQGRVTVGGQVVRELGTKVDPAQNPVALDGQKIQLERPVYFAVYKPKGYVSTTNDPAGRPRVLDLLPEIPQRVYTVGRLDEMSVGLMLLTNDGELANQLAHPRYGVEKLYRVVVAGSPSHEVLKQLTDGIWLAEGKVRAKRVRAIGKRGDSTILELVLAEGKNREVRRMLAKLGHKVMMLTRVAVGPITTKGLVAGQFRSLTGREVDLLRRVAAGQPVPMPWMTEPGPRREPARPRRPEGNGSHDRRPGPRPMAAARPGPHQRSGPPSPPSGPGGGPRPGPGNLLPPSERPGADRRPGPRPSGPYSGPPPGHRAPNDRGPYSSGGPRPSGPHSGPPPGHRAPGDRGPHSSGGPRQYGDGGPRPSNRPGDDRRPGPRPSGPQGGPDGGRRPGDDRAPVRPGGPRPFVQGGPRPSDRPGGDRQHGPRPPRPQVGPGPGRGPAVDHGPRTGGGGPRPPRRPGPPPVQEPRGRRVIGMDVEPAPAADDRPKPRAKRPTAKRPPPRPAPGSRPKPRRRPGDEGTSE